MPDSRGRTGSEREAARIERERIRAQRAGSLEPAEPLQRPEVLARPEDFEGPHGLAGPEDLDGRGDLDGREDLDRPEDLDGPEDLDRPEDLDGRKELDGREDVDRPEELDGSEDLDEPEPLPRLRLQPSLPHGEQPPAPIDPENDIPAGTRSVSRLHRVGSARRTPQTPKGAAAGRAPRAAGGVPGRHSRAGRVISLVALVLAAVLIWFLYELFQPFHGSGQGSVTVTIPAHSSSSQVGDLLARDGVTASGFFFELRATLAGERSDLRPGTYHLKHDMSYGDVLKILTTPPVTARVTNLTITEGRTRREIDTLLRSQHVRGAYFADTRKSRLLDPRSYGAPARTHSLEGFLFPATYQLVEPISIPRLIADQLRTFRQRFASVKLGYAHSKHLTPYDVLIIASMVEAEAATAHDRPLVASVIYNRLKDGMPLQIDATTRYATGNYTTPLTVSELNSPSPYNTRIHTGLTPTPIDNPGLASIQAAAHPAQTNYLFFVVKPCGNGEQVFTSSYARFLAYVQQYQTARRQRGGRSPAHC